jgi:hypothetical protein
LVQILKPNIKGPRREHLEVIMNLRQRNHITWIAIMMVLRTSQERKAREQNMPRSFMSFEIEAPEPHTHLPNPF